MCLLVVCDAQSTPSREELLQGACRNPDGFGFAIMADGAIISERTMNAEESIDRFLELRAKYPSGYAMWHCRIATHGGINLDNCHPFPVGNDGMTYLAHNGTLSLPMPKDYEGSDTKLFAEVVLPSLGGAAALDDPYKYHILEKWAVGSKVAVLTVDPAAKYNLYILNENSGDWDDDGVWWSNTYHRPIKPYVAPYSWKDRDSAYGKPYTYNYDTYSYSNTTDKKAHDEPQLFQSAEVGEAPPFDKSEFDCAICSSVLLMGDIFDGVCSVCNTCIDCNMSVDMGECLCWWGTPTKTENYPLELVGSNNQPTTRSNEQQ